MWVACGLGGIEVMMFPHLSCSSCLLCTSQTQQSSSPTVSLNWEILFANQYSTKCLPATHLSVEVSILFWWMAISRKDVVL